MRPVEGDITARADLGDVTRGWRVDCVTGDVWGVSVGDGAYIAASKSDALRGRVEGWVDANVPAWVAVSREAI